MIKQLVGYVPYADSVSFRAPDEHSWEVRGYFRSKNVYTVKNDRFGVIISLPSMEEPNLSLSHGNNPAGISNLKAAVSHGTLTISFLLPTSSQTTVQVFDDLGHLITTYDAGFVSGEATTIQLPQTSLFQSGAYFVSVVVGGMQKTEKIMVVK